MDPEELRRTIDRLLDLYDADDERSQLLDAIMAAMVTALSEYTDALNRTTNALRDIGRQAVG